MGKARKKPRIRQAVIRQTFDATPERLSKGDDFEFINPAEIDDTEQPIGYVRRIYATPLDKLYRSGVLSHSQWAAGDWYRTIYAKMKQEPRVVASYGERTTGGETTYGLLRTDAQIKARDKWRSARAVFPADSVGFMDRMLLHNKLPNQRGWARMKTLTSIRIALSKLAEWHGLP